MTANSPAPTVNIDNQYGSPKNDNSQAIIRALLITGKHIAKSICLENIIPTQAINVANVPNGISKEAVGEKQLANKQPRVKPIVYFLLKKQSKTMISENLNWIGPYAIGDIAIVKAAYAAAIRPLMQISLIRAVLEFSIVQRWALYQ